MMRQPVRTKRRGKDSVLSPFSMRPPYRGLNTRDPLGDMKSEYASILQNWWPSGVRVSSRAGARNYLTAVGAPVKTLASWEGQSGSPKLFAIADTGIFDATAAGAAGASVQARTEGWCRFVQYSNSAGIYLVIVNGVDDLARFDGTTWTTVASFTKSGGGTLNTADLINVTAHKRRLWFVEAGTSDAWYLDTDAISGTAYRFVLGPLFSEGGFLQAIATWTLDSGAGPDDYCAFISSKGQVAVYSGIDPSSTTDWSLIGVFQLAPPLGYRCATKVSGDLLIATEAGIFSMTQIMRGDSPTSSPAFSDLIQTTYNAAAAAYGTQTGWQMEVFPQENMLLVNVPTSTADTAYQFARNLITGAWTVFIGWNALCFSAFNKELFFGSASGVEQAWYGFTDFDNPIYCKARCAYSYFGGTAKEKHFRLCRPNFVYSGVVVIGVGMDTDLKAEVEYEIGEEYSTSAAIWDTGVWDESVWGALEAQGADWIPLTAWPARSGAFRLRTISVDGRVSWSLTDFLFELGAVF